MKAEVASDKILLCSHCPKEFRYNSEKKRHELSHFPRFECETCSKKFSFVSALRRHQKQHERTESVKCEECHRKFRDDVLLKRHMKYAHTGTYICEKCNSKFSSDLALATHMKTHKPESERRFKCSHEGCTKTFNFPHHLKHHELTHTNAKQHFCSVCGKGFIQSHHLKVHMKSHDPAGAVFCDSPGCTKKFSTDYAKKRHMSTHKMLKSKPDSGISSDSQNSCEPSTERLKMKDFRKEITLCTDCGETTLQNEYEKHAANCNNIKESNTPTIKDDPDDIDEWPNSPFKPSQVKEDALKLITQRDCNNTLLECCIIDKDNCIGIKIASPVNENYDLTPIENNNDITEKNNNIKVVSRNISAGNTQYDNSNDIIAENIELKVVKITNLNDNDENDQKDMCEHCDCLNICNDKVLMYDIQSEVSPVDLSSKTVTENSSDTNIEYRIDGIIKIKNTFDDDIAIRTDRSSRFIPFSTCKDVIGNCLVSNDCLCARMMADEDKAIMAQEIDDITPQPNFEVL